jgi:RNA polymerase sigma factor (sigma-70 family)
MPAADTELLDAWAAGDTRAASELFDRYLPQLIRFFRNKVVDSADDLVQDTFVACVRGRDRFRRDSSFRTYLFATARNILMQHFRKRRGGVELDPDSQSVCDMGPSPTSILGQRAEHRLLLSALRKIPLDHQIALELYHWEGLSGPELAEALGIGEPALRSRLHRAKLNLRETMATLAESPELLASTWANLDDWARGLRDQVELPKRLK